VAALDFASLLGRSDAVIVVPPFASVNQPMLGPHLLQACARAAGFEVRIAYANLALAGAIGEEEYVGISRAPVAGLLGERFFARSAHGLPPLGGTECLEDLYPGINLAMAAALEQTAVQWMSDLAGALADLDAKIVGCSTMFAQTTASTAILKNLKRLRPDVITIIGGANCEGEMAEGIRQLCADIDYVFSGESEASFLKFLKDVRIGCLPPRGDLRGNPCADLDALPTPDFGEFFEQFHAFLPQSDRVREGKLALPYESSRGCRWGEKHVCRFCGLSREKAAFRAKSVDRTLREIHDLSERHPSARLAIFDSYGPEERLRILLPRLASELPGRCVVSQQKADLGLSTVAAIQKAGFAHILAGVESLSDSLLQRMGNGGSVRAGIAVLRYARSVGLRVAWNLLYGFPGDEAAEYEETLLRAAWLHHLQPPVGLVPMSLERFSPYFEKAAAFGITNVRPLPSYAAVVPAGFDAAQIAWHFEADFRSQSREDPDLVRRLAEEVETWRTAWAPDRSPPALEVTSISEDRFLLLDTRDLPDTEPFAFLTRRQASLILAGPTDDSEDEVQRAVDRKAVIRVDSEVLPLATAAPELIEQFEARP
jgi:ribosomal peptide maturation radical SAM protein 1